jgi:hypothetical protein
MKALIFEGKIIQLADKEFPVAKEMHWVDVPDIQGNEYKEPWVEVIATEVEESPAYTDEDGNEIEAKTRVEYSVTVDEDLKAQTLNERQQAETERLAAETVRKQAQDARLTRIRSADLDRADINQLRAVVKDIAEHLNLLPKEDSGGT